MVTPHDVLSFTFGPYDPPSLIDYTRFPLFFRKDPDFDRQIQSQFEAAITQGLSGAFDHWADESPIHALALVILLDQFPRNVYRGTAQAFASDSKALSTALSTIAKGWDKQLPAPARTYLYISLEHSESIETQRRLLRLVEELIEEAPDRFKGDTKYFYGFAKQHHDIVERFGRFPHRNVALGRESTQEEVEFMKVHPGF